MFSALSFSKADDTQRSKPPVMSEVKAATPAGPTKGVRDLPSVPVPNAGPLETPKGTLSSLSSLGRSSFQSKGPAGQIRAPSTSTRVASAAASLPGGAAAPGSNASLAAPSGPSLMQQRSDRVVMFLSTLVSYPFMYLMTQAAASAGVDRMSGVKGGGIDTRQRLTDFPEGAALVDLESWCYEPVYSSWWIEVAFKMALVIRQLLLIYLPHPIVLQVLQHPKLLQVLGRPPQAPLHQLVDTFMPRAQQMLTAVASTRGAPHSALSELQSVTLPSLSAIKMRLEEKYRLRRGPTPLERLDFLTRMARTASTMFFTWLRGLARLCTYISSLLSVVSGALSFTVVPSIILSVISALLGVAQLMLMGTADLLEPAVNGLLAFTESGKDTAAALGGSPESSPVGPRQLPAATMEQLEAFFDKQLNQVSGLLNRPEIPHLASLNKPLLVKAYDLGLIDAKGRTETRVIAEMLAATESQNLLHVLSRGVYRVTLAASSLDLATALSTVQDVARGVANGLLPGFMGGNRHSLKQLFRPDGFFSYADERTAQVAVVLIARLLSWLHLASVVAPGSRDCLRFVLVLGEAKSGKATLFSRLVDAPAEYAAQLGGAGGAPLDGTTGMGAAAGRGGVSRPKGPGETALSSTAGSISTSISASKSPSSSAPAVDMRQLSGVPNTYVVCFPGLNSADKATRQLSTGLAGALGGLASAVVFLVHPGSEPSPDKLSLLVPALAAGCHVLIAINGPGRVRALMAGSSKAATGSTASDGFNNAASGVILPSQHTPLEALRSRWQSAAEMMCATRGFSPSLLGVVVSELQDESAGDVPPGVHHFRQLQDWINTTAAQAHRMV